jgi:hypothetical protein
MLLLPFLIFNYRQCSSWLDIACIKHLGKRLLIGITAAQAQQ